MKAILEGVAQWPSEQSPRSVTVYWGGRAKADLYWAPAASGLAFRFVPVLSRPDDAWLPSAASIVTVSVGKSTGDTPAHNVAIYFMDRERDEVAHEGHLASDELTDTPAAP